MEMNDNIQKLGVSKMIKEMERSLLDHDNADIHQAKSQDFNELILDLSLKYQVLSKKTAFICKIQENVVDKGELVEKIIVPSLLSKDYS